MLHNLLLRGMTSVRPGYLSKIQKSVVSPLLAVHFHTIFNEGGAF